MVQVPNLPKKSQWPGLNPKSVKGQGQLHMGLSAPQLYCHRAQNLWLPSPEMFWDQTLHCPSPQISRNLQKTFIRIPRRTRSLEPRQPAVKVKSCRRAVVGPPNLRISCCPCFGRYICQGSQGMDMPFFAAYSPTECTATYRVQLQKHGVHSGFGECA